LDLNKVLSLSDGKGKSACQALCQRAQIFMKEGHEDMAKKDLQAAADQGNSFAKSQVRYFKFNIISCSINVNFI
jgi:hypothetical protein